MIHQTIRADAPYLVHHSVPLQLPHESSHPLPVQLSHNERPPAPITHQVSQVSHGDMNSMHLSHVYGVPHNELSSATTVNSMVPVDQDLIDVGQDNLSENTNMGSQRHSSSSDNMKKDNVKKDSAKLQSSSSKSSSNKENGCSDKKVQKVKDGETKSVKPKQKRLKSTEDEENIKLENRSGNTKLKRKRSDDDKKEETVGVKKPKIKTESQEDVTIKQNVTTKLKDSAKEKDTVKQKETVKQKSTAKPSDTLKQNSTTQLKGLNTLKQKDALKKAKPKEVKIEVKEIKKKERKSSGGNKEKVQRSVSSHGWAWEGEPEVRTLTGIVSFIKFIIHIARYGTDLVVTSKCSSESVHQSNLSRAFNETFLIVDKMVLLQIRPLLHCCACLFQKIIN